MTAAARYAGARVHRVEDARLLTGTAPSSTTSSGPGMLHACFVRSPLARARIAGIDVVGGAGRSPGCTRCSPPRTSTPASTSRGTRSMGHDVPDTPRPPLAEGEVRFVGDPVALVVAVDRYVAEDAAELVVVDYEPLPPVVDYADRARVGASWCTRRTRATSPAT